MTLEAIPSTEIRMSTQLLVLSACQTDNSASHATGENISIAHTFAQNGVPRVIGTLWDISDSGTMRFMEFFYDALFEEKKTPSQALQKAQQEMIKLTNIERSSVDGHNHRYAHPVYWAAFKLVGDWQWPPPF